MASSRNHTFDRLLPDGAVVCSFRDSGAALVRRRNGFGRFSHLGAASREHRWPWAALHQPELRNLRIAYLIFLGWGIFETVRGIFTGYPALNSVRDLSVNYYPLFFFLGLWAGIQYKNYLQKFIRVVAWANGIYGILFIVLLTRLEWYYPSGFDAVDSYNPVSLFGQPSFSAVILLGLLSFEKNLGRVAIPLALNAFVLISMLIRAEWLAFALGLLLWLWFTKNLKRAALCGGILVGILAFMYFVNFTFEGAETRRRNYLRHRHYRAGDCAGESRPREGIHGGRRTVRRHRGMANSLFGSRFGRRCMKARRALFSDTDTDIHSSIFCPTSWIPARDRRTTFSFYFWGTPDGSAWPSSDFSKPCCSAYFGRPTKRPDSRTGSYFGSPC